MNSKLKKIFIICTFLICLIFIFLQIFLINYDSTSGREYEKISLRIRELELNNGILSQKVASASSMTSIITNAKLLGFDSKKAIVSFYSPQPLAAVSNKL